MHLFVWYILVYSKETKMMSFIPALVRAERNNGDGLEKNNRHTRPCEGGTGKGAVSQLFNTTYPPL